MKQPRPIGRSRRPLLAQPSAVALVAVFLATDAVAQRAVVAVDGTIRGVAVDSVTGRPVSYALIGSGGQRWFATEAGRFVLTGLSLGPALVTVTQIGYAPVQVRIEVVTTPAPAGAASELEVRLHRRALVLPELSVNVARGCARGTTAASGGALDDPVMAAAFENAERLLVLERTYPFRSSFFHQAETFDDRDQRVERQAANLEMDTRSMRGYRPGRVVERSGVVNYFTTSDLARPAFRQRHCFWLAGRDSLDGRAVLTIEFAPTLDLTSPDWAGRLSIDSTSAQLSQSVAHLVNVDSVKHGLISGQCIVRYGEVVATIVHESRADCVTLAWEKRRTTTLEVWELLRLRFQKRRPGQP